MDVGIHLTHLLLSLGHNKRRCVKQPAGNGRAERARDWVDSEIENSEIEDSGIEDSDENSKIKNSRDREIEAPASPVLQLHPKRTRQAPVRYAGWYED